MAEAAAKRSMTAHPSRTRLAEYERQEWIHNAELGVTVEDIMLPAYWAHMAELMNVYDHIEVRIDDGAWIAYLIVTARDRNWARVKLREKIDLVEDNQAAPAATIKHSVEWKGPQFKWTVIRLADGEKVRTGCASKEEAANWMREHERTVGM